MSISRRHFLGFSALAGLAGCARIKQSRIGQLTPDFSFRGDGTVRFAALGDLHIRAARDVGILGRAVNEINNDKTIDFAVVLGDLTAGGTLAEMNLVYQALGRLEKPYYVIPGEHDINPATADGYEFYTRTFGRTQWKHVVDGWVFIGLDTCNGNADDVTVPADRLEWLQGQLNHTDKKKPIVLLTHHPFGPGTKAHRVANADEVLDLFRDHQLRVVASGHYHGNQVEERDGIVFTTTASCSRAVENDDGTKEKGYRVFTLTGDNVEHEFVAIS